MVILSILVIYAFAMGYLILISNYHFKRAANDTSSPGDLLPDDLISDELKGELLYFGGVASIVAGVSALTVSLLFYFLNMLVASYLADVLYVFMACTVVGGLLLQTYRKFGKSQISI